MATLNGTQINNTYPGLIKTTDNAVIGAVEKEITDGEGNSSTLKLGTTSASFVGTLDLTGATVTGIPAAGLVAGTGTDSMESDAALTTTAADAQGNNSIALGDNTVAYSDGSILIGNNVNDADNSRFKVVSIGNDLSTAQRTVNIGNSQNAYGADGVCIGGSNSFGEDFNVVLGYQNTVGSYPNQVIIGKGSTGQFLDSIVIGNTSATGAAGAVAIGSGITAATADTVSVKALETQTDSTPTAGGIIMSDAGGTDRRINIDAAGGLQIDSTPVGGAAGLVAGGQTNSMKSAAALTTLPATTLNLNDIAIGENARVSTTTPNLYSNGGALALGKNANVIKNTDYSFGNDEGGLAIGLGAVARMGLPSSGGGGIALGTATAYGGGVAMGYQATTTGDGGLSIGWSANAGNVNTVAIGKSAVANAYNCLAIGESARATGGGFRTGSIAIGANAQAQAVNSVTIGNGTIANQVGAVVIGDGITTSIANTVSVKALETQTNSTPTAGGIIMSDAGGTDRRINIDAAGGLQIDSTPVGAAGLVAGTGTDSIKSADTLTTTASAAEGTRSIAIGDGAIANSDGAIAIGSVANVPSAPRPDYIAIGQDIFIAQNSIAIGKNTNAQSDKAVVIGYDAVARSNFSVVLGNSAFANNYKDGQIVIGQNATGDGINAVTIGQGATTSATGAVALGVGVSGDTVNTTTVNLLQIAAYASMNYADDTAAAAGGIPLGGVYHTTGALKIRIV